MTDLQGRIAALSPERRAVLELRIAEMAAVRGTATNGTIQPRDRDRPTPLSYAQQREWALERFRPSNNISGALRLDGTVDIDLFSRILTEVTARHEVLRSTVETVDRGLVQVVHPVTPIPVPVVDLGHLGPEEQRREVRRQYDAEVLRPFPPEQVQRLRATLLKLGPDSYMGLLTIHHASSDGWSAAIVLQETATLYRAFHAGGGAADAIVLAPPAIQYGDFAAWQRERLGEEWMAGELRYWHEVLDGMPPRLALPTDRPHTARRTFEGDHHSVALSGEATTALQRFAETRGVSISMIMLAACSVLLHRYTRQDDLVFGTALTGRSRVETEGLIGCFANALPLRMRVSRGQRLGQVLDQARDVASAAFDHQDIPFDRLIEEFAPTEASQTPLIQMMINVLTTPGDILRLPDQTLEVPDLRITPEPMDPGPVPIDIILGVQTRPGSVHMQWHYSTELFDDETVVRLADQLVHVLEQLVTTPDARVADVELLDLTPAPTTAPAALPAAAGPGFVELFQRQAATVPDAPAVVCDGVAGSFAQVNREANRIAHHLRGLGAGPDTTVGILLARSPKLAEAVLGVLKSGAAFVPLDPEYPADRIAYMLTDAGAPLLITTEDLVPLAAGAEGVRTVVLGGPDPLPGGADDDDPVILPAASSPAYVIYTSGSTGLPKGAVIEHRSLVEFSRDIVERLQLGAGDRFLQFASPGFDVLVEELFPIWLAGGAVVIPHAKMIGPGIDLVELTERERISVMELPAAYWHEWVRELDRGSKPLPPSLRLVIVGAERVLPERLAMWQKLRVPLMHVYGITETTVSSTFFRLSPDAPARDLAHLPIGTPLPSARLQILDDELRTVPAGAVGELYIGGVSVARGYLHRPALTAQRFVADPDPAHPGERVYRTGDLVRRRMDGNLEFLARADAQITLRGFRVEPAEVESAICRHPQIAQAVVAVHEPAPGDRRLVAYIVPQARTQPSITDVRRFLTRELPRYLVPSSFVQLLSLPLTTNGKVDHERLPAPDEERPEVVAELVLPRSEGERQLAEIVAAILGVTQVGVEDNFFELGGDSILAIQVAAKAQEVGIELSPFDLFENPTVAQLAQLAQQAAQLAQQAPEPGPQERTEPSPSDFPLARVDQGQLDALLGSIAES